MMSKRRLNLEYMMGWMKKYMGFLLFSVLFLAIHTSASSAEVRNIVSDDFNVLSLNTSIWTPIDPLGDATFTMTGTGTSNAALNINIPGGTSHDAWITNNAPRVMQTVDNTDFQIEAKFLSIMTSAYQTQGIIIEQDSNNYIRFDFIRYSATETRIFSASISAGSPTQQVFSPIASGNPLFLRINRTGDQWKQFYSYDGNNWNLATSFSHALTVNSAGLFAANVGSPAPSFTAKIDYFFNSSSPVVPEDQSDTTPPSIDLWYGNPQRFGQLGVPQKWVNILGNVNDESGVTTLNYSLNGASALPLTIGPDHLRLQSSGDFNIEINRTILFCGNNTVLIKAVDSRGNMKSESMTIQYSCNNVWPKTYSINWSDVTNIQDVAQIVDGKWIKETNSIRPAIMGYDRVVAIGDITWDDYEITAPITINSPLDPSVLYGNFVGFVMRWHGHEYWLGDNQPNTGWYPLGAFGGYSKIPYLNEYRLQIQGNNSVIIADDTSGMQLAVGVPYIFKMRAQTVGANSVYSLRVWEQGTIEPSAWTISGLGPVGELKTGSAMLIMHNADVSIGNVNIRPINDTTPPVITNVVIMPDVSSAIIRWNTDESATSKVSYGRSTAYENGSVVDGTLVTSHSITLTGLKNGTQYHFKINSIDASGNSANTADLIFTTTSPCPNISDDFNASTLDSCWTVINPKGDATITVVGNGTGDGLLSISVPAGQDHDAWTTNNAPRIMKYIGNKNFEIEVKFKSQTTLQYQEQGLIIQQDINNYLRFDIYSNSASTTTANIYAASFAAGNPSMRYNSGIPQSSPIYMRVNRTGDSWKQFYSNDGNNWILAANFNYPIIVSSVGPFAGNAVGSTSPAFTSLVDYIIDTSSPIIPTLLPPSITTQPVNTTVSNASTATFSVVAGGTPLLSYQWKKNGVIITSATGTSYTTPIVNLSDNGTKFSVVVSNAYGSMTSDEATLTVTSTPPSILSNPGFESGTAPWSFYTNGAGMFSNDAPGAGSPHAGHVTISVQGTNVQLSQFGLVLDPNTRYSLTFKAYSNTGHDLSVSLLKNVAPYTNYGLSNYVANLGTSWNEYSVQFTTSGFSTTVSDGRLMFWLAPYDAASDQYYFDDVVLTKVTQDTQVSPTIITQPTSKTITAGQTAIFSVAATGTSPLTYQWKKNGINITSATGTSYTTPIVNLSDNSTKFSVLVSNAYGSVTSNEAELIVSSTTLPPSIIAQPVNITVFNGSGSTFSVVAGGTTPLSYQWKKNGVNITSATGPSYTIPIVYISDNGTKFSVVVSNGYGSVTSNQATLTVTSTPPPSILSNPGFESGTAPWSFYTNGAGTFLNDAAGAGSPHAGHVTISVQGTNVQLSQFGLVLDPNTRYSLTFKAYSNTGHDLSVSLLKNVAPYTNYGLSDYVVNLGTSWSEYSVQFTTSGFSTTVSDGRLMFWLAPYDAVADYYYFDDVVLIKVS